MTRAGVRPVVDSASLAVVGLVEVLAHLPRIRQLLFEGQYLAARDLCAQCLLGRKLDFGTHLPLARAGVDVAIEGHHRQAVGLEPHDAVDRLCGDHRLRAAKGIALVDRADRPRSRSR